MFSISYPNADVITRLKTIATNCHERIQWKQFSIKCTGATKQQFEKELFWLKLFWLKLLREGFRRDHIEPRLSLRTHGAF